jgi:hypothetical protein
MPGQPIPRKFEKYWAAIEKIRDELVPNLGDGLWRWILMKRGWDAGLAILETAILVRAGHVRDPGGYFWGIVKPSSDCAPALTVGRIMIYRRAPGMTSPRLNTWPKETRKRTKPAFAARAGGQP